MPRSNQLETLESRVNSVPRLISIASRGCLNGVNVPLALEDQGAAISHREQDMIFAGGSRQRRLVLRAWADRSPRAQVARAKRCLARVGVICELAGAFRACRPIQPSKEASGRWILIWPNFTTALKDR